MKNKMMALLIVLGSLFVGQAQAHKEFWLANIIGENEAIMHATAKRYVAQLGSQDNKFNRFAQVHINAAKDSYAQATRKLALFIQPVISHSSSLYNGVCSQAQSFVQGFKRMLFGTPCFQKSTYSKTSSGTEGFISSSHTFTSNK